MTGDRTRDTTGTAARDAPEGAVSEAEDPPSPGLGSGPGASSLEDQALALAAAANRLVAGERERAEADRVRKRIGELEQALDELTGVVQLAASLSALSGDLIDVSAATRGLQAFAGHATGRPSDIVFNRAKDAIARTTAEIREAVDGDWARWSDAALRDLPLHRLAVLPAEHREAAQEQETAMRGLTRRRTVTSAQMHRFDELRTALASVLDAVAEPPVQLRLLLERLEQGPVPLSDLDDREIALLRQVGDQIDVRRRHL